MIKIRTFFLGMLLCGSICAASDQELHAGLGIDWLDKSIDPAQDFYGFANGSWQKNNPIPPEYASWGSFNLVNERVQKLIHQLLIDASNDKQAAPGSIEQKVGDFYYSGMDEAAINQAGITPLNPEFNQIQALHSIGDLPKLLAHLHQIGVNALFSMGNMQDFKDSTQMIAAVFQAGLGLPDRDYYLKPGSKFEEIRKFYVTHLKKIFELLGDSKEQAAANAQVVMSIETRLAKASMTQIERRDPHAVYHMKTLAMMNQLVPNFSWTTYLKYRHCERVKNLNEAMPEFFKVMNNLLVEVPLDQWKAYFRWHLVNDYAPYLSTPFVDQNFKMTQALNGTEKLLPRWKRVVNTESGALGFAIGKLYVEKYFPESSKKEVMDILKNIRQVLQEHLMTLPWMAEPTREAAIRKLKLMEERIGYPVKWWDYSSLIVDRGPYALNVKRASEFLINRDLSKIGKPIDRTEWEMTPQTINAYYDPSMNNLNMPAGILQSPFFDPKAPAAVNYGAIGFVMGHEMTHGFDDQGAQFDAYGNLKNWWTPRDLAQFKKATQCISNQFSQYVVDDDLKVQGPLVMGEATADLGGLVLAYKAFLRSEEYKNARTIDGFTPEQQFFLGAAHVWAMNIRPLQLRNQVTTDPHPPARYRVNGSFANIPEFQKAFHILGNSPMVNVKRCVIW